MESSPLARKPCGTTQTREMKKIFDQAQNLVFDTPFQKKRFTTFFYLPTSLRRGVPDIWHMIGPYYQKLLLPCIFPLDFRVMILVFDKLVFLVPTTDVLRTAARYGEKSYNATSHVCT